MSIDGKYFSSQLLDSKPFSRKLDDAMDPLNLTNHDKFRRAGNPFNLKYPSTVGDSMGGAFLDYNTNQSSEFANTRVNEGINKDSIEPYVFFEFMSVVPRDKNKAIKAKKKIKDNEMPMGAFAKKISENKDLDGRNSALSQIEYSFIGASQTGNSRQDPPKPGDELVGAIDDAKESGLLKRALREYKGSIAMYMPTDIQFNDTIQYNENSRRIFGIMEGIGIGGDTDIFSQSTLDSLVGLGIVGAGAGIGKLGKFVSKFFGEKVGGFIAEKGGATGGLLGAAGAGVVTDEYQRSTGRATNPHEYMAYQNTGLRSFTYTFTFLPDSKKESEDVTQIIKEFRHAAHADKIDSLKVTVPEHVIVSHHGAGDMIQLPPLVIEAVNVTYNPNNASFFLDGGNPVEVGLSVTFREIVPLFKKDIEGGM
jgi:hypothetical protein